MLAVTVTPGGSPALRELPSPTAPPGGVLVRVRACGLCGSDVEKLRPGGAAAGSVLGHEIAGVVVDGALPAGLRVALAHHVPCGACARCLAGHEPLCAAFVASALEPGGFCELTAASAEHVAHALLPLPDHVSDLAGSFVEPLACVLRGIEGLAGDAARGRRRLDRPARGAGPARARLARADARARSAPRAARPPSSASRPRTRASASRSALLLGRRRVRRRAAAARAGRAARALQRRRPCSRSTPSSSIAASSSCAALRSSTPRHLREALALIARRRASTARASSTACSGSTSFDDGLARYRSREALKVVFAP